MIENSQSYIKIHRSPMDNSELFCAEKYYTYTSNPQQFPCNYCKSLISSQENCKDKIFEQQILLEIMDFFGCKWQHFDKINVELPNFDKKLTRFFKERMIDCKSHSQETLAKSLVLLISLIKSEFSDKKAMKLVNTNNFLEDCLTSFEEPWKFLLTRGILFEKDYFEGFLSDSFLKDLEDWLYKAFAKKIESTLMKINEKLQNSRAFPRTTQERLFFALTILQSLRNCLEFSDIPNIYSGKFTKTSLFSINHTLILAENGGLYCLLNRNVLEKNAELLNLSDTEYIKRLNYLNPSKGIDYLSIGRGGMGFVGLGITLWGNEQKTIDSGDIVCIKQIVQKDISYKGWLHEYTNFNVLRGKPINIPDVYDLKMPVWSESQRDCKEIRETFERKNIVKKITENTQKVMNNKKQIAKNFSNSSATTNYKKMDEIDVIIPKKEINTSKSYTTPIKHCESYIIMEFLPFFSSDYIFSKHKLCYKDPAPILSYLISLFENVIAIMNSGYFLSDLKPSNTLYDRFSKRCFLIDFAGVIPMGTREKLKDFHAKHIIEFTKHYIAVEIKQIINKNEAFTFDGCKAVAFSLGVIITEVAKIKNFQKNKEPKQKNSKSKHPAFKKLKKIADSLLIDVPENRFSVEEALGKLLEIEENFVKKPVDKANILKMIEISFRNTRRSKEEAAISDSFRENLKPFIHKLQENNKKIICLSLEKNESFQEIFPKIYYYFLEEKQKNPEKTIEFPIFFEQDCEEFEFFLANKLTNRISFTKSRCFFFMQSLGNSEYQWYRLKNIVKRLGKERANIRFCCLFDNEIGSYYSKSKDLEELGYKQEDFVVFKGDENFIFREVHMEYGENLNKQKDLEENYQKRYQINKWKDSEFCENEDADSKLQL